MAEEQEQPTAEIVVAKTAEVVRYNPADPTALYMNGSVFNQLARVAKTMAMSHLVPQHLQGDDKVADCFLVVAQAIRWRMDPFAVAQNTYVARGRLGYEGKIIAAIINSNPQLAVKLNYKYSGERGTNGRSVKVIATLKGETEPREIEGSVGDWKTDNAQWKTASGMDQMLSYRGAREWARRYMPEAVLGVQSIDEVQEIARQEEQADPGTFTEEILGGTISARAEDDPKDGKIKDKKKAAPKAKPKPAEQELTEEQAKAIEAKAKAEEEAQIGDPEVDSLFD